MSGTTGQGSPSLSDSTILQLQNEIERLKARVDMASLARDDYRKRLKRSEQELDALKAENERLLSVVDAKIQDLARANGVGVALVRECDQAREALREMLEGMDGTYDIRYVSYSKEDITRWRKALQGGGNVYGSNAT